MIKQKCKILNNLINVGIIKYPISYVEFISYIPNDWGLRVNIKITKHLGYSLPGSVMSNIRSYIYNINKIANTNYLVEINYIYEPKM